MKAVTYVISNPPGLGANEMLDMILVSGVFDQPTTVVFIHEGVRQVITESESPYWKNNRRAAAALPEFDVLNIHVDEQSLNERNIDKDLLPDYVKATDRKEISSLLSAGSFVVTD